MQTFCTIVQLVQNVVKMWCTHCYRSRRSHAVSSFAVASLCVYLVSCHSLGANNLKVDCYPPRLCGRRTINLISDRKSRTVRHKF